MPYDQNGNFSNDIDVLTDDRYYCAGKVLLTHFVMKHHQYKVGIIQIYMYTIVIFGVLCHIFGGSQVCQSIALPQPMKNLEGMEWKSHDHV